MAVRTAAGTVLPRLVYGTAWKKDDTADLVYEALAAGFRAIDTAAQPRHYREDLVAAGIRRALEDGIVTRRADLYIQTKFTPLTGQDPDNLPYDPAAPLDEQVRVSVEKSLKHFDFGGEKESYLDCVVLHSPYAHRQDTQTVWRALQAFVPQRVRSLGVSNVTLADLQMVVEVARPGVLPAVVQNRFCAQSGHDVALRRFCGTLGSPNTPPPVYQSFWTLTANRDLLRRHRQASGVEAVAAGAGVAPEVALYALVSLGLGDMDPLCPIVVLDGTRSRTHMDADLAGLVQVEAWANSASGRAVWSAAVTAFRQVIGEDVT